MCHSFITIYAKCGHRIESARDCSAQCNKKPKKVGFWKSLLGGNPRNDMGRKCIMDYCPPCKLTVRDPEGERPIRDLHEENKRYAARKIEEDNKQDALGYAAIDQRRRESYQRLSGQDLQRQNKLDASLKADQEREQEALRFTAMFKAMDQQQRDEYQRIKFVCSRCIREGRRVTRQDRLANEDLCCSLGIVEWKRYGMPGRPDPTLSSSTLRVMNPTADEVRADTVPRGTPTPATLERIRPVAHQGSASAVSRERIDAKLPMLPPQRGREEYHAPGSQDNRQEKSPRRAKTARSPPDRDRQHTPPLPRSRTNRKTSRPRDSRPLSPDTVRQLVNMEFDISRQMSDDVILSDGPAQKPEIHHSTPQRPDPTGIDWDRYLSAQQTGRGTIPAPNAHVLPPHPLRLQRRNAIRRPTIDRQKDNVSPLSSQVDLRDVSPVSTHYQSRFPEPEEFEVRPLSVAGRLDAQLLHQLDYWGGVPDPEEQTPSLRRKPVALPERRPR
jgi:hypothetical protein